MTEPTIEELTAQIAKLENALAAKDDELRQAWSRWKMANAISSSAQNELADIKQSLRIAPKPPATIGPFKLVPITAWFRLIPTEEDPTIFVRDYNHFEYFHISDPTPTMNGKVQSGKWEKTWRHITNTMPYTIVD